LIRFDKNEDVLNYQNYFNGENISLGKAYFIEKLYKVKCLFAKIFILIRCTIHMWFTMQCNILTAIVILL
jgi:hypothetical protein